MNQSIAELPTPAVSCQKTSEQKPSVLLYRFYRDLRRLARARLSRLPRDRTLQTTGLIHDAYMRLDKKGIAAWNERSHFFAAMEQAMRDTLVEYVRRKRARKRGGDQLRVSAADTDLVAETPSQLPLHIRTSLLCALEALRCQTYQGAEIVLLRCFFGLTTAEIANLYSLSTRTIERKWQFARTWLQQEMQRSLFEQ